MHVETLQPAKRPSVPSGYFKEADAFQAKNGKYKEKDINNDGLPDVMYGRNNIGQRYDRYFTYNEAGQVLSIIHDFNGDKTADFYDEFEYDENGNKIREKQTAYDLNGKVAGITEIEYGDGYRIERSLGEDGHGNPLYFIEEYDADDKLISIIQDLYNDGEVDFMQGTPTWYNVQD